MYNFDMNYMNNVIKKGNKLLLNKNLSKMNKELIIDDINMFKRFINNNYEIIGGNSIYTKKDSFSKLRVDFLKEAKEHYEFLGESLIDYIIKIYKSNMFNYEQNNIEQIVPFEKQVELTLKNYKIVSPKLYEYAKKFIIDKSVSQIQVVNDINVSSFCHYSDIVKLPFVIINPNELSNIFNHEVQHALEDMLRLKVPNVYAELGSITLELLFNDRLYEEQNYLFESDYGDRLEDISFLLIQLCDYLQLLKRLKKYNFNLNNMEFKKLCSYYIGADEDKIYDYLTDVLNDCFYDSYMCYVLSFFKAIEIRKMHKNHDVLDLLKMYYTKNFKFEIPKDGYKIYEKYVDEMKQKTKRIM